MDCSYPTRLGIWEGWSAAGVEEIPPTAHDPPWILSCRPAEVADRLYASEALRPWPPPLRDGASGAEPYSLQWFLNIEHQRHHRQGRWIPGLLEFSKHPGETLLGLGSGLGTDWLQYARHGAAVVVCSPSHEQLGLIRRNFELRGLTGRFLPARPTCLPLESASIDVVCGSLLLHEIPDPHAVVDEIYRVLKPGGKVLVMVPARYDVEFWYHVLFPWQRWLGKRSSPSWNGSRQFSARGLKRLFARFVEHRVHKRQLRRAEVPHLWRWAPLPLLERLMGHTLILKAFKPLSAAMVVPLAA